MIKGKKHSEETKRKISESNKGKTPKNISIIAGWNKNMKCPWVAKTKLGTHWSEETRNKIKETKRKTKFLKLQLKEKEPKKVLDYHWQFKKGYVPWNYKGGTQAEYRKFKGTIEYKEWRKFIFERDNYECQFCHKKGYIEPHHIRCVSKYPNLKLEKSNGITLCRKCHLPTIRNEDNFIVLCEWILQLKSNFLEENKMNNEKIIILEAD